MSSKRFDVQLKIIQHSVISTLLMAENMQDVAAIEISSAYNLPSTVKHWLVLFITSQVLRLQMAPFEQNTSYN